MINISEIAVKKLNEIQIEQDKSEFGLRIGVQTSCSGLSYYMGFQKDSVENDTVLDIEGLKLFIDEYSKSMLEGAELDYMISDDGEGFVFKNPNAVSGCSGCNGSCG